MPPTTVHPGRKIRVVANTHTIELNAAKDDWVKKYHYELYAGESLQVNMSWSFPVWGGDE